MSFPAVSMLNVFVFNDLQRHGSCIPSSLAPSCWRVNSLTFCVHMLWCQHTITPYGVDVIRLTLFPERHDFWIQFSCHFIWYFGFSAKIGVLLAIFPTFIYLHPAPCLARHVHYIYIRFGCFLTWHPFWLCYYKITFLLFHISSDDTAKGYVFRIT
jgi:hypothetical protein